MSDFLGGVGKFQINKDVNSVTEEKVVYSKCYRRKRGERALDKNIHILRRRGAKVGGSFCQFISQK